MMRIHWGTMAAVLAGAAVLVGLGGSAQAAPSRNPNTPVPPHFRDGVARLQHAPVGRQAPKLVGESVPKVGTINVIAIRVQFAADTVLTTTGTGAMDAAHDVAWFSAYLGELSLYYTVVSHAQLNIVPTVSANLYTLSQPMAYYSSNQLALVQHTIAAADGDINFYNYDAVIILHAGAGHETDIINDTPSDIHSHFLPLSQYGLSVNTDDNAQIAAYLTVPETENQDGLVSQSILGVLAHEFGHQLGAPDLYQTVSPGSPAAGDWTVMATGSYNGPPDLGGLGYTDGSRPAHPDAWTRHLLGWADLQVPAQETAGLVIPPVENAGQVVYAWTEQDTGSTEYFLLENRQPIDFDAYLPGSGLLVWRIDDSVGSIAANDVNDNVSHLRVKLVQADGLDQLGTWTGYGWNRGDGGDPYPGWYFNQDLTDTTTPDSRAYDGGRSFVRLTNISNVDSVITLDFNTTAFAVEWEDPTSGAVLETLTPTLRGFISAGAPIELDSVMIFVNDELVMSQALGNLTYDPETGLGFNEATGEIAVRVDASAGGPLSVGFHTAVLQAADSIGHVGEDTVFFSITAQRLAAGLRMVSVPFHLEGDVADVRTVFALGSGDVRMARWDPTLGEYDYYPDVDLPTIGGVYPIGTPADSMSPAGAGFWVELPGTTTTRIEGDVLDPVGTYVLRVYPGWNMVGTPLLFPINWSAVQVRYLGETQFIADAAADGWIRPTIYTWAGLSYAWAGVGDGRLEPWVGYWVRIMGGLTGAVELVFPPTAVTSGAPARSDATELDASGGWQVQLNASAGAVADAGNVFGVSSAATDRYDGGIDIDEPPAARGQVSLRFVHRDWGTDNGGYLRDIRAAGVGPRTWDVECSTDLPNTDVTLTWPNLVQVPKDYRLLLEDVDGGRTRYMRTTGAYTYQSGPEGGTRHLRIIAEPNTGAMLGISNLRTVATRGTGMSISFDLSASADVTVEMRTPAGKLVRQVAQEIRPAGTTTLAWRGVDLDNRAVPAGPYLCEIFATAEDGQRVRAGQMVLFAR